MSSLRALCAADAPFVSGFIPDVRSNRGIRSTLFGLRNTLALDFNEEETIGAQTGVMLHLHHVGEGFFTSLLYDEIRAILALVDHSRREPNLSDARTVTKYDTWMTD
ncbi:MAG: hypothetical protein ABJM43_13795 [Paracoccaceae bacterium]